VEKGADGERVLELRYTLRNTTRRDIALAPSGATLYVQRNDGTLIDLKQAIEYKLEDVTVPAGDTIAYLVHPKLPYKADKDCKVQPVDDPTKEQIAEY